MKVCFYGNTGHALTAFLAKEKLRNIDYAAFCPSYPGENMKRLEEFANQAGCRLKEYSNPDEMLENENPDILANDNPYGEHYPMIKKALSMGIHVYTDKPIATDLSDLTDLHGLVKDKGLLLWAMHTTRYDPWYYTAKRLIEQGAIGKVRMVNCQKSYRLGVRAPFFKKRKTYGGSILWVAIHAIDMIRMVTGRECLSVYSVQSAADNFDHGELEMLTTSSFEMEDDILATITTDYYRPSNAHSHDDDRLRIVGTKGIIEVARREGMHQVFLLNDTNKGFEPVEQQNPPLLFEDFVNTLEGKGSGIFSMRDTFLNTATAIYAQKSADEKKVIKTDALNTYG